MVLSKEPLANKPFGNSAKHAIESVCPLSVLLINNKYFFAYLTITFKNYFEKIYMFELKYSIVLFVFFEKGSLELKNIININLNNKMKNIKKKNKIYL